MKQITIVFGLLFAISAMGQSKISLKQIEKENYKEVIGYLTNSTDSIKPDKYAMYPDGIDGIIEHISKNLKYPWTAYMNGIQGKVLLEFFVGKDGNINTINIIQSVDPELDAEAIRVIKKLKKWVSGYKNGEPVMVKYQFPIYFKI